MDVTPEQLVSAAGKLDQLASRVDSERDGVRNASANANLASGNLLAQGQIDDAARAWTTVLHMLADKLRQDARNLRAVASLYGQNEAQIQGKLKQLLGELES